MPFLSSGPPPLTASQELLCWAAMSPIVFPDWHRSTTRYRGSLWEMADWPARMDPREPARRWDLYRERGGRSRLLASDTWALEVRVYGEDAERQYRPQRAGESGG